MQSLSELIETSVLAVSTGKQIGIVEEVVISLEKSLVLGIFVQSESWFSTERFIAFSSIFRIGFDAVMIKSEESEATSVDKLLSDGRAYRFKEFLSKQIFSESGMRMGIIADIDFDHLTGELKGYRLSEGIVNDFVYGRHVMPLPPTQLICDDRVIVSESMVNLLQY